MVGTDVHNDPAVGLLLHALVRKFGQLEGGIEVDLHRPPPRVDPVVIILAREAGDTLCGVDENVQLPSPDLVDNPHHLEDVPRFVEVALDDSVARPVGDEVWVVHVHGVHVLVRGGFEDVLVGEFGRVVFGVVVDEDGGAAAGEFFGNGGADSARGAGDQGSFAHEGVG